MPYFTSDMECIRLCVLFILEKMTVQLNSSQLITAVTEATESGYFDVQLAISELEDKGFLASVSGRQSPIYAITPKGADTLSLMAKNIPLSMRNACEKYVEENKERILNLGYFNARSCKSPNGGYDAVLSSMENDRIVLSVVINVADPEICRKMCAAWETRSGEVYDALFDILLKDKE